MMKRFMLLCSVIFVILSLVGEAAPQPAAAATYDPPQPYLVKDIDLEIGGALLEYPVMAKMNETLFFIGNRKQLWKSDGTQAGTSMVKDVLEPMSGYEMIKELTNVNGTLFFVAAPYLYTPHDELWKSDGTETGTMFVKSFYPGSDVEINNLFNFNGIAFFTLRISYQKSELWKSDGTAAGTEWVANTDFGDPIVFNNALYFWGHDEAHGSELWKSDGTPGGTGIVKDIYPGSETSFSRGGFVFFDDKLFFSACTETHGCELWETRGTAASTQLVKDINPGSANSDIFGWKVCDNLLFFAANDGTHGRELWKSNGATGTEMVKDIHPSDGSSPYYLTVLNNHLFFRADDGTTGNELWKSDGTEEGTLLVKGIRSGTENSIFTDLVYAYDRLFFAADDGIHGNQLWKSDGTTTGTTMVSAIAGEPQSRVELMTELTDVNGILLFAGQEISSTTRQLWGLSLQDLILTQSVTPQTPVSAGQPVVYTLSFFNNGHIPSSGVTIADQLPGQLNNFTWTSSGGITVTLASSNPHVWQVGDMQPGEGGTITVVGTVKAGLPGGSSFANTATISNSLREVNTANNTSTTRVSLEPTTVYNISLPVVIRNWPPIIDITDAPNLCVDAYPINNLEVGYLDNFEAELDPDWYRFEAAHGSSYIIDAYKTGANLTPVIMLYDNNCQYLGQQGLPSASSTRLQWTNTLPAGWYRLLIYEANGHSGAETDYKLTIQESP